MDSTTTQQITRRKALQELVTIPLTTLTFDQALISYHGEFMKPAQQLLAYAHQMVGKIAFDRLDFAAASGHFSEMIDLGEELHDSDIITLGMTLQASIFRKRGRFEHASRYFNAAKPYAEAASAGVQGVRHNLMARLWL